LGFQVFFLSLNFFRKKRPSVTNTARNIKAPMTVAAMTGIGVPPDEVLVVADGAELVTELAAVEELAVLVGVMGLGVEEGELLLIQDVSPDDMTVLMSELPPCRERESVITKITEVPL
jgi:hypothetical protein